MKIINTFFNSVQLIEIKKFQDNRGWFAEQFNVDEINSIAPGFSVVQQNLSFNDKRHTLRGLHFQTGSHAQAKIVSVLKGSILDVFVDIRKDSDTFGKWHGVQLRSDEQRILYIPRGFAHGYLTLEDNVLFSYLVDNKYSKLNSSGILWNDKKLNIEWGVEKPTISEEDERLESLKENYFFA